MMGNGVIHPLVQQAWASRREETLVNQLTFAVEGAPPVMAIVFDAYGTLFDLGAVEAACARLTPHGAAFAAHWRAKQLEYTWLRTLMGAYASFDEVTAEALDYTLRHFDLAPDEMVRQGVLAAWRALEPFPDVPDTLARLSDWPLAILSNGNPAMLEPLVTASGLGEHFRLILSVDGVGAYKPDPRAYALAHGALGIDTSAILFVSANPFDVIGAKSYGYQVVWCNRAGLLLDHHGPPPDLELRTLSQLADLLGR